MRGSSACCKAQSFPSNRASQNLILMTSSSWRASYVFCVYAPHVLVEFVGVSNNRPDGRIVAPKEVLSPGLNCVLLNRFVACAARLTEYRSHILNDFSIDMFTFQAPLLRMSPKVAADAPYQKRSATTDPFGVGAVRPAKASTLYLRKQPLHGVILRPLGNVTVVFPSYQRCNSLGTSSGTPKTRSGSPLIEFVPPFESGKTNPLWAVKDTATRQPPTTALRTGCLRSNRLPFPIGRS